MRIALPSGVLSPRAGASRDLLPVAASVVTCIGLTLIFATNLESIKLWHILLAAGVAGVAGYCLCSSRLEVSLLALMFYVGAVDGFAKLGSGLQIATLGRDILLYSIAGGAVMRLIVSRRRVTYPPLSGWVVAFVAIVAVQVLNPHNASLGNSLGGIRPHLEFVPLFFLGYFVVRTRHRLRVFLLALVVLATLNGIVGLVQANLTPQQLANWGPGYRDFVLGNGTVSGRTFAGADGLGAYVRPFGLGSDTGAGGLVGLCAVGAALALVSAARNLRLRVGACLLAFGVPLAVFTAQSRGVVVAVLIAGAAYVILTVTPRRIVVVLVSGALAIGLTITVVSYVEDQTGAYIFDRYSTISPDKIIDTAASQRGNSLALLPNLVRDYPLGGGIASVGPASSFAGGSGDRALNGETFFTLYVSSLGIPGLFAILGLMCVVGFGGGLRILRIRDPELRALLAAVVAPIIGLLGITISGGALVATPTAPFFWVAAGIVSYWLFSARTNRELERHD